MELSPLHMIVLGAHATRDEEDCIRRLPDTASWEVLTKELLDAGYLHWKKFHKQGNNVPGHRATVYERHLTELGREALGAKKGK
jgi:hypothetical protein